MFDFSQVAPPSLLFSPLTPFSPRRAKPPASRLSLAHFATSRHLLSVLPSLSVPDTPSACRPACLPVSPSLLSPPLSFPLSGLPALPHTSSSSSSSFHFQIRVSRASRRSASSHCILHAPGNNKSSALLLLLLCFLHFVSALPFCTKEMRCIRSKQ